ITAWAKPDTGRTVVVRCTTILILRTLPNAIRISCTTSASSLSQPERSSSQCRQHDDFRFHNLSPLFPFHMRNICYFPPSSRRPSAALLLCSHASLKRPTQPLRTFLEAKPLRPYQSQKN